MPSGHLYIAVLAAAVAAFFLVPVAQAAAAPGTLKVKIAGTGKGEATTTNLGGAAGVESRKFGTPIIRCAYASPGPQTGTCEDKMPGSEGVDFTTEVYVYPASGSEFGGWVINKGEDYYGRENGEFCNEPAYEAEGVTEYGGPYCAIDSPPSAGFGEEAEVTVFFCTNGSGGSCASPPSEPHPHVTVFKQGEGTVVISPGGGMCTPAENPCLFEFEQGQAVTLTASPATGYVFSAWAGCTEHLGLTCKVKMSNDTTVKVTFVATPSLTIEKAGTGQGKVGAPGISCDENCSKASSAVKTGTAVTVKVTPAKGSKAAIFENGTGSASSGCSGESCTFTISSNSSVKVKFDPIPTHTLTVNLTGPAAYKGKVTGKGVAKGLYGSTINCGAGCTTQTELFFSSDTATLTAVAAPGYTFAGWSGSGCSGTGTCTVATSSDKTVEAEFE